MVCWLALAAALVDVPTAENQFRPMRFSYSTFRFLVGVAVGSPSKLVYFMLAKVPPSFSGSALNINPEGAMNWFEFLAGLFARRLMPR